MSIREFNSSYLPQEDRLLFRIRTVDSLEYRFLLTRRVTLFIIGAARNLLKRHLEAHHSREAAAALAHFSQESFEEKIYNGQPVAPSNSSVISSPEIQYPIGFEPVLVMDVVCDLLNEAGVAVFAFDFILPGGGRSSLKMPIELMQSLQALLDKLCAAAVWAEPMHIGNTLDTQDAGEGDAVMLNSGLH